METIGQRIRRERDLLGLTQRELAEKAGVGVPHISKLEADRENPGDGLLAALAEIFGVPVDELLLVARRMPDEMMEWLAEDPVEALEMLRTWKKKG